MSERQVPNRFRSQKAVWVEAIEARTLFSANWYVSPLGSDSNPGTLLAPFQTIQRGADASGPGDTVFIRGGVYHETVTVHHAGTPAARIIFKNYNNESVTVDGADPISGWTNSGGSVWTAPMPGDMGQGNNQIFVDNKMINEARWPNMPLSLTNPTFFDLSHPTVSTVGSATAGATVATINDSALTQPAGFWVGASIRIGSGAAWVNQTGTVTASSPGSVTFSYVEQDATYEAPTKGNTYYLFGTAAALDAPGEFIRSSSGQLSVWMPASDNPAGHVVEAKARQFGFDLTQASNIRIDGLKFFACSINTANQSANIVINHISAEYLQQFSIVPGGWLPPAPGGIILRGQNDVLENSVIAWSAGDGVYVSGSGVSVANNLIHDIDYAGVDAAAVRVGGYGTIVDHNTIYNAGRNAMLFSGAHDRVTYNLVHDYALQTTDAGGFYSYGLNGQNTLIAYNRFYNGHSTGYGVVGIFIDGSGSNFLIHHNITWNVDSALRLNGAIHNLQIYNNTFDAITWGMDKDGFADDWTNTILENNIITHPIMFGTNVQLINNISNHHQFVDAPNGNFTLLAGAPAVDTGLLLAPYTNGYVGSAPDVGALELGLKVFSSGATLSALPPDPAPQK